jgi:hypothetical protein
LAQRCHPAPATDRALQHKEQSVMAKRNTDTQKSATAKKKPASPDTLTKSGEAGKVELSEDELKDVSGGAFDAYLKIK